MRTANPALNEKYFHDESVSMPRGATMTVQGAAVKTGVLTVILVAAAAVAWNFVFPEGIAGANPYVNRTAMLGCLLGGCLGGLVLALVISFAPKTAPFLSPVYAGCEGAFLGAISGLYAAGNYPGIILQAAMLTIGVLVMMFTIYATRIIVVTDKLRTGIFAATGAVCLVYLASMLLNLFGVRIPYIHDGGTIGIAFSAVVIIIAAMNLVLDFDTVETGARYGAPKYMEWFAAFGLLVTLVWLYLEILRLLSKLNSSRD